MAIQITFNIDSANIGSTVEDVFKSLTAEDKRELARGIMLEVMTKPNEAERLVFEQQTVEQLIREYENASYTHDRIRTEAEARGSYRFRERMAKFESSRDRMMRMIVEETTRQYKDMVAELVKNDVVPTGNEFLLRVQNGGDFGCYECLIHAADQPTDVFAGRSECFRCARHSFTLRQRWSSHTPSCLA